MRARSQAYRFCMAWTTTEHAAEFLDAAGPLLRAKAASNTILLTAAATVVACGPTAYGDEPPLFGWWTGADRLVDGASIHTPPFPAQLSAVPDAAIDPLAAMLAAGQRGLDNPTSNALYRRLGFEPVEDRISLRFEPRA